MGLFWPSHCSLPYRKRRRTGKQDILYAHGRPSRICLEGIHFRVTIESSANREQPMSLQNHLAELERRHVALKKEIETEATRPAADDLKMAELKRKKLLLKDEIEKLKGVAKPPSVH
jgi:hypothetical protein